MASLAGADVIPFPNVGLPPFRRELPPEEAAAAVSAYLPADPAYWLECAGLAGMTVAASGPNLIVFARRR